MGRKIGRKIGRKTKHAISVAGLSVTVVAVFVGWPFTGGELAAEERGDRTPAAHYTDDGADGCLRCHAGDNMVVMLQTAHGNVDDPHAPFAQAGCESCHGPGSLHVSRARGGAGFPPLASFGRGGDPAEAQLAACLGCHRAPMGEQPGMDWGGSLHDTGRMTCSTCHQVHVAENVLADPARQKASCATCHEDQIAGHSRFEGKGIVFERLTCHDCHDVHQLISRQ